MAVRYGLSLAGLLCAVLSAGQAIAAEGAAAAKPTTQSGPGARASGKPAVVQQTRLFGDLSLSLSLTLSRLPDERVPDAAAAGKAKALNDLNTRIAALEEEIRARQQLMEGMPAGMPSSVRPAMEPMPAAESAPAGTTVAAASGVPAAGDKGAETEARRKAVEPPAQRPRQVVTADSGMMEWAAGAAVLLLAIGLFWHRRRKPAPASRYAADPEADAAGAQQEAHKQEPEPAPPEVKTLVLSASPLAAQQQESVQQAAQPKPSLLPPEYEMLEEADIYLRFGHDKLAEEALREAIRINPRNPQPYLTLLRIFFSREDKASFLELAQQLKLLGDTGVWPRVIEMGRSLDPDNPLYR